MRAIVQRVNYATLSVDGKEVSHIGRGFMVLLGISCTDTEQDAKYIAEKLPKQKSIE